ncbi:MAG: glycoside hydrolase family 3 C-terminal domain-containing protein [Verrucomicrobia bacterium]|nr:glycoside hydrolase family 3 C-terminal domain-containing protein [Verrucomicrobiota bacterium]
MLRPAQLLLMLGLPLISPAAIPPVDETQVNDLLARMTQAEKIGQLSQGVINTPEEVAAASLLVREGRRGSFILSASAEQAATFRNQLQKVALEQSRLRVPLIFGYDAIHGYRTTFPIPLGLAAAWDAALVERAQAVSARETRAAGIDWTFAPMCDLARDPRWGRVAETFGEDPYLGARLAAASVRGFQGDNPAAPDRVAATLKHYVGYSATVGGRDYNATDVTPFSLRNAHLPAFQAGVAAGALSVMSGFNATDGIPAVADHHALTNILRGEWGFNGFVVSDWTSVEEAIAWGYAADRAAAARLALTAGNDMEMVSTTFEETLPAQLARGDLSPALLDEAVRRVLRGKLRAGVFAQPYTDPAALDRVALAPDALATAREAAARSIVLLKNNGTLPLAATARRIALIGPLADDAGEMLGTWPGHGRPGDVVTLAAALRQRLPASTRLDVEFGCELLETGPRTRALTDGSIVSDPAAEVDAAKAKKRWSSALAAARRADVIIAAVGEPRGWSGENASRAELDLTGRQSGLLAALAATGKPLVVVVFSGRPLVLTNVAAQSQALLQAWHPGLQGGPALAALLYGDQEPTGRLPISFPRANGQVPIYYNHAMTGRPTMVDYRDLTRAPLFPFGFGLGYTEFTYGAAEISTPPDGPAVARTIITNTGKRPGQTVAQFYVRDVACSVGARPVQELRGWETLTLAPGESRTVSFPLDSAALGFTDRQGRWLVEPGDFQVWIAPHAGTGTPLPYRLEKAL